MQRQRNRVLQTAMRLVEAISAQLGTTSYIWGGFTMDIYEGRMLREHGDLDYLTVDLERLKPQLAALFAQHRWPCKVVANGDLSPRRGGFRMQLGNITLDEGVRWSFNGDKGFVVFPRTWLLAEPVCFCGVQVHVVAPEFEYMVKCCPQIFNPDWHARPRESEALARVRSMLEARGVDPDHLYYQISLWREAERGPLSAR